MRYRLSSVFGASACVALIATGCSAQQAPDTSPSQAGSASGAPTSGLAGSPTSGSGRVGLPLLGSPVSLDPADFTTAITHPYWPMKPGMRWTYRERAADGSVAVGVTVVTRDTKKIADGITARGGPRHLDRARQDRRGHSRARSRPSDAGPPTSPRTPSRPTPDTCRYQPSTTNSVGSAEPSTKCSTGFTPPRPESTQRWSGNDGWSPTPATNSGLR
jgi:hypothetical protein